MTNKALNSFRQEGSWNSSYWDHYQSAWLYLYDYEEVTKKLKSEENCIVEQNIDCPNEFLSAFIHHETRMHHVDAYRYATSAHLFVCMAVEGFVNYYGVKRLGEATYKRLLERVGITEKIALIYLLCFEVQLSNKNEMITGIRTIFDQRNALVHPKTKEVNAKNIEKFIYKHPDSLDLKRVFQAMEQFFQDICSRDSEINRDFNFAKPVK